MPSGMPTQAKPGQPAGSRRVLPRRVGLTQENGEPCHYNTSILVETDGLIGGSVIIAPTGEIAGRTLGEDDEVITATLDLELGD
ncbi:MAG TPA: hypothetical protein VKF83_05240 [Stellaceae bacterium]|nr:hypothetical protein [Stellaceae bacterium]